MARSFVLWLCLASTLFPAHLWATPSYYLRKTEVEDKSELRSAVSFLVPGFSQWRDGQQDWAMAYSGTALAGGVYALVNQLNKSGPTFQGMDRDVALGLQLYQTSGSVSLFHGFRTAIFSEKNRLRYDFLPEDESPIDVVTAPFRFDYLLRPTTLVPLALVSFLFISVVPRSEGKRVDMGLLNSSDYAFLGSASYMAGTGEEALFRGTMMPYFQQTWKKDWLANVATAGVFALAHVDLSGRNLFIPWPQFLGGLYFGWVTQYRDYHISEAIFLHVWYDVLAFATTFATGDKSMYIPIYSVNLRF